MQLDTAQFIRVSTAYTQTEFRLDDSPAAARRRESFLLLFCLFGKKVTAKKGTRAQGKNPILPGIEYIYWPIVCCSIASRAARLTNECASAYVHESRQHFYM